MRSEKEMMDLILGTAREDDRIRAVWMNGSRTNPNAKKDIFQDYDIVYAVTDVSSFTAGHSWVDRFGERIIMQMPDASAWPKDEPREAFAYLMQFEDGNRIDLTLVPSQNVSDIMEKQESLTKILLDKDDQLPKIDPPNDRDYHVKKPTEAEFLSCCNEYWWVSLYVAKGLWREEVLYAKGMLDGPVRAALIQMLDWKVGIEHDFKISMGKFSKELRHYLDKTTWQRLLETYPTVDIEQIWQTLYLMADLFHDVAKHNAEMLDYHYNEKEEQYVRNYLKRIRNNEI
ncbi:aminoglycoside 6-adenylyltransferase [Tenuibacillus multivorans]|uniref:Aminoglycoside 6-adenylyltransferase n=1 Tax=Tenuibacillus multivorans TaxID=237069 RepID=A0A1H0AQU1_9BACI|nr:aminoglycoside 6-adenylyltransferase [Tenuibacillus multivorans]GEL77858.1 aminoglycoside 6-adenylyltransferase [Tenuibacillus multivorans]SDN35850.1 aminoglycoside 6-adenylyltransferase [Tenuibacillus multivorans]